MIAVDTNILVYAINRESDRHQAAVRLLGELVASRNWALPATVLLEFYAHVTERRLNPGRDVPTQTLRAIAEWTSAPGCHVLADPLDIWERVRALIESSGIRGQDVHDARIAATCIAHGVRELWTADGDFLRFPELRVRNPLVA